MGSTRMVRIAVVPIEGKQTALTRHQCRRLVGEFPVQGTVAFADYLDPPLENVSDGRLSGLDAVEPRQDCALDDTADARDVWHSFLRGDHTAIASGCADDLDNACLRARRIRWRRNGRPSRRWQSEGPEAAQASLPIPGRASRRIRSRHRPSRIAGRAGRQVSDQAGRETLCPASRPIRR